MFHGVETSKPPFQLVNCDPRSARFLSIPKDQLDVSREGWCLGEGRVVDPLALHKWPVQLSPE